MTEPIPGVESPRAVKAAVAPRQAELWAREIFGLEGSATPLPGFDDRNFLLDAKGAGRWVVKVAHSRADARRGQGALWSA